jgi:hypothetical protein
MLIILSVEEGLETMCNRIDNYIKEFEEQDQLNLCITICILGDIRKAFAETINDYLLKTYNYPCRIGLDAIPVVLPVVDFPIPATMVFLNSQQKITDWKFSIN